MLTKLDLNVSPMLKNLKGFKKVKMNEQINKNILNTYQCKSN